MHIELSRLFVKFLQSLYAHIITEINLLLASPQGEAGYVNNALLHQMLNQNLKAYQYKYHTTCNFGFIAKNVTASASEIYSRKAY